jgi:hypothetical protein
VVPCPACQQVAFQAGQCRACGFRIVTGTRGSAGAAPAQAPPPMELPADALVEVLDPGSLVEVPGEDDGPSLPGFESTALAPESAPTPTAVRQLTACPRCRAQQPRPMPAVCDGCGFRLRPRTKKAEVVDDTDTQRCSECGISNPADRSNCLNCAARLYA